MSIGKSKSKTTSSQQQQGQSGPDAATQAKVNEIYGAGQQAGAAVPQSVTDALSFLNGKSDGSQYMNPYQQQVIDAYLGDLQHANAQTANQVADQFTKAGAFGGSRQAVAQAVAQSENQRNTMGQIANLRQQGYSDATNRALMAANLGMGADPNVWRLQMLKQGFAGMPYGTTYSGSGNSRTDNSSQSYSANIPQMAAGWATNNPYLFAGVTRP